MLYRYLHKIKLMTMSEGAADWHELMIYRSALCGRPLPTLANSWTHGAASRRITASVR